MRKKIGFDVGACLGESIPKFQDFDQVYLFEPLPLIFETLSKTCENDSRLKCFNSAVSNKEGSFPFHMYDHYGYASFYEINKDSEFAQKCAENDPGFDYLIDMIQVDTIRLDNFMIQNQIDHIDFLKIDTQGNDLNVIKSLGSLLNRVDRIEVEAQIKPLYHSTPSKQDIIDYMTQQNFVLVSETTNGWVNGCDLDPYEQVLTFERNASIPMIGTAVVNSSYWVSRLLMSIDYPVDNFVIINNNGRGELDEELNSLTKIKHKYVKNIKVTHLPANIGVSGAWNLMIKSYLMSPYWIIVNDDVAFSPGFLEEMVSVSESDPEVGIIHGNSGDYGVGSWDLFLIRDFIIQEFGLFDENLYPAYCEDADYLMRFMHKPIKKVMCLNSTYYHGNGDKTEYYKEGSQTQKTEPHLKEKLDYANELNIEYLTEKWGPGWRMCNPENLPFRGKEHSISSTTYDLGFIRKKYMGF